MVKYGDLVQFEPIESVIQLKEANDLERAFHLLDTYVISDRMAEQLNHVIINQLQFEKATDNKGLLIVGNYGTGKSHLMSVISTIAEREGSSEHIHNAAVAAQAKTIEGRFKVIRLEIGSVATSLRDILCSSLEDGLSKMDIDYSFPDFDKITNNKDSLEEMMGLFNEQFPNHGLLVVVDELLDYLRGRKEQELTLDLGFLREIGEISNNTRFRFIAGIQEMLFDNPRFNYVAEPLRRVKERFEQVRIIRDDIAYVVSERLLKKTDEQKALIREHLSNYKRLYNRLNEDMEKYVNLYPIHPSYLDAFENVNNIEKRVALRTISIEMNRIINENIPASETGIISFDSYWSFIEEDPSYKTIPEVAEVMEKVKIVKDRVQNAYAKRLYKPMALRIVNALALNRLSTVDIYDSVGLTAEELRDDLFLSMPGGNEMLFEVEDPSDFLKGNIDVATKEIQKTVSFQYLSVNDSNGQYYLDLKKDVDIDSLITQRAEIIEEDKLDRYYFDLLKKAITLDDSTYVSGYKIWRHDLPWDAHHVKRQGYLFFGAPNERSTAQPERDFYIYMLRPYLKTQFKDEKKSDEIFFELNHSDEQFEKLLKQYAAADDLKIDATSAMKGLYQRKIDGYFKELVKWLNNNFISTFSITYKGKRGSVLDFGMFIPGNATIQEIIDVVAEGLLTDWFAQKYPDYPIFSEIKDTYLSKTNLEQYVKAALDYINGTETKMGQAMLKGLVLLDNSNKVSAKKSGYASWVRSLLEAKGPGKVLNYNELIETIFIRGVEDLKYTREFRLEPELLVVVLAAMISVGDLEIIIDNKAYNATSLNDYVQLPLSKQIYFSHVKKPTDLPYQELGKVLSLFNVSLPNFEEDNLKRAILILAKEVNKKIDETLDTMQLIKSGFPMWEGTLLSENEIQENVQVFERFKEFCETIKRYDTPAKMRNFKLDMAAIEKQGIAINLMKEFVSLREVLVECMQIVNYVQLAQPTIGLQTEWSQQATEALDDLAYALRNRENHLPILQHLLDLKLEYIQTYIGQHDRSRLNATENNLKKNLLSSNELNVLKQLANQISILPNEQIHNWESSLQSLKECYAVTIETLEHTPVCNNCKYRITEVTANDKVTLKNLKEQLPIIYDRWIDTLLTSLNDPSVKENIELLHADQKELIEQFMQTGHLTLPLDVRLIQAINDLLKGLRRVEITPSDLENMMANGSPMTVEELRKRFDELINRVVGGNTIGQVRVTLKK